MAKLDSQIKIALDENRLLILGGQVLTGFAFEMFFQERFETLSLSLKYCCLAITGALVAAVGFLIFPSVYHRLVNGGHPSSRILQLASATTSVALLLIGLALSSSAFVLISRPLGSALGLSVAAIIAAGAATFWFGLEFAIGIATEPKTMRVSKPRCQNKWIKF
jgi:hypothetical protein